ncbi:modification methylase HgiDII [Geobacter sp. OR-1]|uniref:DNA cytosine methyltransferase n=1 Tax=Geobacter sp. OR-1 TaxID=1266765 RepID=UPI00054435D5|nr:DNA cytosine methyltransferase [Geobacter sp. OR-1]GAM08392.1 modification methylase HgiDII [Geobacter sp. OR-1]
MIKNNGNINIAVYDFFCGCGGTSRGFQKAGMDIAFALDVDQDAKSTFTKNFPSTVFCDKSIKDLSVSDLQHVLAKHEDSYKLFCGCAPCQPFTKQNTESRKNDERKDLLTYFGAIIKECQPDFIFVENVPGLQKVPKHNDGPFPAFKNLLEEMNYKLSCGVVAAQDYGAPQLRRRFVLLASKHGEISIPEPTHGKGQNTQYKTVFDAIADLPVIAAGESYAGEGVLNHRAAMLSEINMQRIKASAHDGGGRNNWPRELRPECYTRTNEDGTTHSGHTDCYGRLWWKKPATGLTTRCISYSNGRFGHPEQDRAISVREAARLQGFDDGFEFFGSLNSMARQIGNAVPVDLAFVMGNHFIKHVEAING